MKLTMIGGDLMRPTFLLLQREVSPETRDDVCRVLEATVGHVKLQVQLPSGDWEEEGLRAAFRRRVEATQPGSPASD
jgi:hypothetical protein